MATSVGKIIEWLLLAEAMMVGLQQAALQQQQQNAAKEEEPRSFLMKRGVSWIV